MRNFSLVSEMREGQRSWGTSSGAKFEKQSKHGETQNFNFRACHTASVTLKAVSLQLNGMLQVIGSWMLMMRKIRQAMYDDATRTARIHPAVHPGNRDEVSPDIWQNFQPAYRSRGLFIWAWLTGLARLPGWILPWVHMRNFSPVSEMRKGQRSWGRVLAPNSGNKANIAKHKNFNFRAYLSIGNS